MERGQEVTDYRFFLRAIIRHSDLVTKEASFEYLQNEGERMILEAMDELELAFSHPDVSLELHWLKPHVRDKPLYGTLTSGLCWSPWLIPHNVLLNAQNAGSADKRTRPWSTHVHGGQCSIARSNMAVRITLHTSQDSSRFLRTEIVWHTSQSLHA